MKLGDTTKHGVIYGFKIVEVRFDQREIKFAALCRTETGHESEVPLADLDEKPPDVEHPRDDDREPTAENPETIE